MQLAEFWIAQNIKEVEVDCQVVVLDDFTIEQISE